ncbi:hypothetical protein Esti_005912 [Eimeria stiedai]
MQQKGLTCVRVHISYSLAEFGWNKPTMELLAFPTSLSTSMPGVNALYRARFHPASVFYKAPRHSHGGRPSPKVSVLPMLIACSVVVFLLCTCAFRLEPPGARDVSRLADGEATDDTTALISCSSTEFGSTRSEVSPGSAAVSDDQSVASQGSSEEQQSSRRPKNVKYSFPLIAGEENKRALRKLMRSVYELGAPHIGLCRKSCSFRLGNFAFTVEARELAGFLSSGSISAGRTSSCQRIHASSDIFTCLVKSSCIEFYLWCLFTGCEELSNGFLIKEEGREGRGGLIQVFVDVVWAVWPPPSEELSIENDAAEGAAGPPVSEDLVQQPITSSLSERREAAEAAGSSVAKNLPQQSQPLAAGKEGLPPPAAELLRHSRSGAVPYMFLNIPGEDNQRALEDLIKTFYSTRWPHTGKRTTRCLLEIGDLYVSVEAEELTAYMAALKLEQEIFDMLATFCEHQQHSVHVKGSFMIQENADCSFCGVTKFSVKVYRIRRPLVVIDRSKAANSPSRSTEVSSAASGDGEEPDSSHG